MLEEFEVRDAVGSVLIKKESQMEEVLGQGSLAWTPPTMEEPFVPVAGH